MHFLQESSKIRPKNIVLARILQDNAILLRYLQVDSFLARSFQAIRLLQEMYFSSIRVEQV